MNSRSTIVRGLRSIGWVPLLLAISLIFAACSSEDPSAERYVHPRVRGLTSPSFGFLVVGDFGIANDDEEAVARGMRAWAAERRVNAFISTGDSVYPEAEPQYFEGAWTIPFGWVNEAAIPVIAALGNHDVEDESSELLIDFLGLPGPWYSRSIGPTEIFVLNSNHPEDPEQLDWAREALTASTAEWKIVIVHKPPFDCGRYDGTRAVRESFVSLFEQTEVDLVLSGHDHNYQRFHELYGVTYIVTGGGGDSLYGLDDKCTAETPARLAGNDSVNHFMAIEGTRTQIVGFAIAADGTVLDRFVLRHAATH